MRKQNHMGNQIHRLGDFLLATFGDDENTLVKSKLAPMTPLILGQLVMSNFDGTRRWC